MEDYYELLDLSLSLDRQAIERELRNLNKQYRQRLNHRDSKIVNEATEKVNLNQRAMTKFNSDEARVKYDKELENHKKQSQYQAPLIDVDFYAFLDIDFNSTQGRIQQRIKTLQDELEQRSASGITSSREWRLLEDARTVLLNGEQKKQYDKALAEKRAAERKKQQSKPVPLVIGQCKVYDWFSLEKALDDNPSRGLFLFQDGEIEAWLRWSLGQKQKANWVRAIAERSKQTDTPFFEFDELQRLINPSRPLILYDKGGRPNVGSHPIIKDIDEIPPLADAHWALFVSRLKYILDWIALYSGRDFKINPALLEGDPNIQLERLLFHINPKLVPPQVKIEGTANGKIDFGTISKWENIGSKVNIIQAGRGYLYGTLSVSHEWIKLSQTTVAGRTTTIDITLDRAKLGVGKENKGHISLYLLDGRLPTIQIDVTVHQRTTWQSVKNIFSRS